MNYKTKQSLHQFVSLNMKKLFELPIAQHMQIQWIVQELCSKHWSKITFLTVSPDPAYQKWPMGNQLKFSWPQSSPSSNIKESFRSLNVALPIKPVMDWRPVQGVPCLSANDSWDRLRLPPATLIWTKNVYKMDGRWTTDKTLWSFQPSVSAVTCGPSDRING